MSKRLTKEELRKLIDTSIKKLNSLLVDLENDTENESSIKRAGLLSYWIIEYVKMLRSENTFDSTKLLKYNRGDIVCVNFGYRIGSELGGRHFAFVLENYNSMKSGVLTVVPLTSKKDSYKNNCYCHELQHGLYELHKNKLKTLLYECRDELNYLNSHIETNKDDEQFNLLAGRIKKLSEKNEEAQNLQKSIFKLKDGTVANLGQIATISKIRILNPKQSSDSLNKIKIAPVDLDIVNQKLKYLYLPKKQTDDDETFNAFKEGLNS